jgi:hypothetical protein
MTLATAACKKEKLSEVPEENSSTTITPVDILNPNSGYEALYNDLFTLSTVSGAQGSIGFYDATIDNTDNLHFAYYGVQPTQQSPLTEPRRRSINVINKQKVPQPSGADTLLSYATPQQGVGELSFVRYRPYSNFVTIAKQKVAATFGAVSSINYYGDISYATTNSVYSNALDLGFRFPTSSIYNLSSPDNGRGTVATGLINSSNPYLFSNCTGNYVDYLNNKGKIIRTIAFESYRNSFTDSMYAFTFQDDSVLVNYLSKYKVKNLVSAVKLNQGFNTSIVVTKHYNTSGTKCTFLVQAQSTNKYSTFMFDFTTNTLTKGLDGVDLEYDGLGTDIDCDELGNVYYSGTAGNGGNMNGVSIYKREINGTSSLIGTDAFLKFGQIIGLKYLMGKVYLAVQGKQSGKDIYQFTILKQN